MVNNNIFNRIPFTKNVKNRLTNATPLTALKNLEIALSGTDLPPEDVPRMMSRLNTESLPGNIDTFIIFTSADPAEKLKYTATDDVVIMNDSIDGGTW